MKSRRRLVRIIGMCALPLIAGSAIERQQQVLETLDVRMDSLKIVREQGIQENKLLAEHIRQSGSGHKSYSEHKKLEKQFQKAQLLNRQIQTAENEINRLNRQYQDTLQALIGNYEEKISESMTRSRKAPDESSQRKHLEDAGRMMAEKDAWSMRLAQAPSSDIQAMELTVLPWDGFESLNMKRDALLDQEDALRREVAVLDDKIRRIRQEHDLRKKMSDMTNELNLFDENEEIMDRVVLRGHTSEANNVFDIPPRTGVEANVDEKAHFDQLDGTGSSTLYPYADQDWYSAAKTENSMFDNESQINILQEYKNKLTARADSLGKRAQWFDDQARSRKRIQE
ncbi:hypothetical protein JW948_17290 [bacterium]|nr:hypothetical protein [bacterium]